MGDPRDSIEPIRPSDRDDYSGATPIDPESRRTERRLLRLRHVLERRQDDLTIVLENVHDRHNVSAVLRTCDAVGVGTVHLVYTTETFPSAGHSSSAGVAKWMEFIHHRSVADATRALREDGFTIIATSLGTPAEDLYRLDLTGRVALVFGNENRGVSEELLESSDLQMRIPMVGFVESLNISVACAVAMYEAMRQRSVKGGYEPKPSTPEFEAMLSDWTKL